MPTDTHRTADIAILGAGPAGCSAASWLSQLGFKVVLIDRAAAPCQVLQALNFPQDWVLGAPGQTLAAIGQHYAAQTRALPHVDLRLNTQITRLDWDAKQWSLHLLTGTLQARALLIATGLRPLRPTAYFADEHARVLDAVALTAQRESLKPGRILLLGGGDNAVENALYLQQRGHEVTLWSRSDWRAQAQFLAGLHANPAITQRPRQPLPTAIAADADGVTVGDERFDHVAVLLGYEPEPSAWQLVAGAWQRAGVAPPEQPYRDQARFAALGLLVAGDASGRQHPCVQTALADGVVAAKQAQWLLAGQINAVDDKPPVNANKRQVLHLTGLRFGANLGVLDFEREGPQPIQVDAEIHLGAQMMVAHDADIGHVLDYRRVRQIIIDDCTAEHTDLLEALLGKLCTRLMGLPGVVGVRIKVAKLEIFPDCQVAISAECGDW